MMKVLCLLVLCAWIQIGLGCPIIPYPQKCEVTDDVFVLNDHTQIAGIGTDMGASLQSKLFQLTGITAQEGNSTGANTIRVVLEHASKLPNEAYTIDIKNGGITIKASHEAGLFYGINSFLQIASAAEKNGFRLKGVRIADEPRFGWRGIMIDESRHFFGKDKIKQILDWMAFYKLNRLHWHLTDSQGWRIAIKKYPKLALVGGIGNFSDPFAPVTYYSQKDILEIVAYGKARFIEIVPEIDMPGHAAAAVRAYPEFSGGGSKAHPDFTFNPGKEETYSFLSDILREVDALFPSQMIHIGGDEVHYGNEKWTELPEVASLMKENGLKDLKEVELYFFQRMADSIKNLNNRVLGWDEVVSNDTDVNPIVFWWRHTRPEQLRTALDKKMDIVMCPRAPMYFDYVQDSLQMYGPDYKRFGVNSVERIYDFSPEVYHVSPEEMKHILGIQGNVWTERIKSAQRLDYMLFPRIAALAEACWTQVANKDFDTFKDRVQMHYLLYEKDNVYYFDFLDFRRRSEPMK